MKTEHCISIFITTVVSLMVLACYMEIYMTNTLIDWIILIFILTIPIWTAVGLYLYGEYIYWKKNVKSQRVKNNVCGSYEVRCKYANKHGGCLYGKCMTDYKGVETIYPKNYSNKIYYVFDWFDERRNK